MGTYAGCPESTPLHQIALRQLAVKGRASKSWFAQISDLGAQYNIDVSHSLLYPIPKPTWKKHVKTRVVEHWEIRLRQGIAHKSTLRWLILQQNPASCPHQLWQACRGKPYQVEAASIRARLLVGRYPLNSKQSTYTKGAIKPSCSLCGEEDEDEPHFLAKCSILHPNVNRAISDLQNMYKLESKDPPTSAKEICSAILNGGAYAPDCNQLIDQNSIVALDTYATPANQLANHICITLHINRDIYINSLLLNGRCA